MNEYKRCVWSINYLPTTYHPPLPFSDHTNSSFPYYTSIHSSINSLTDPISPTPPSLITHSSLQPYIHSLTLPGTRTARHVPAASRPPPPPRPLQLVLHVCVCASL